MKGWQMALYNQVLYSQELNSPSTIALLKESYSSTKTCLFKILKISPPKNWKFSDKNSDIFHTSAQNIVVAEAVLTNTHNLCFLTEIRKIMYIPVNTNFTG